jgi:hypothetical protein
LWQGSDICKEISAAFSRFDAQASSFGLYDSIIARTTLVPAAFQTAAEARDTLENIITYINRSSNRRDESHRPLPYSAVPSTISAQLSEVEILLHKWSLAIENSTCVSRKDAAFQVLKVQHIAATIKTSALFYYHELAYDAFTAKFDEILSIAEPIILTTMKSRAALEFSIDLGVIQPLWFTACKCRHPVLRRKAIYLLNRSGIEGLWDGCVMAAAATWALEFEERGIVDDQFIPEERRLREIGLISMDMTRRKVSAVSTTRALDGNLDYVGATVCWGEIIVVDCEYPNSAGQSSRSGFWDSLVEQWRRRKSSEIPFFLSS